MIKKMLVCLMVVLLLQGCASGFKTFSVGASAMVVSNQYRDESWSKPTWLGGLLLCIFGPFWSKED